MELLEKYLGEVETNPKSLRQRGKDGYPKGADDIMKKAYGKIPNSKEFQNQKYGFEKPKKVLGWEWSDTFRRWQALVIFKDGDRMWTFPK